MLVNDLIKSHSIQKTPSKIWYKQVTENMTGSM